MKRIYLFLFAILLMAFSSCKKDEAEVMVKVNLSAISWQNLLENGQVNADKSGTKSATVAYPARLYFVAAGQSTFTKVVTVNNASDEIITSIPSGTYNVYALCGSCSAPSLSDDMSFAVTANPSDGELSDIQLGSASVTVATSNNATLSVSVNHVLTQLNVNIESVPSSISSLTVHVKDLNDRFFLNGTFGQSTEAANMYQSIAMTAGGNNTYSGSKMIFPSHTTPSMDVAVEAHDVYGRTVLLHAQVAAAASGCNHSITLQYADLVPLTGGISLNDWANTTGSGNLTGMSFATGDPYFSYPATVLSYSAADQKLYVIAHKPIVLTKSQIVNSITDNNHTIAYSEMPEVSVSYWFLPGGASRPVEFLSLVNTAEKMAAMNARIIATGGTAIDPTATNVLAYCTYTSNQVTAFHRYDFQTNSYVEVTNVTDDTEFIIYPIGKILLNQ